jgi:outer membrane receptor protein involved in Fe transport
MSERNSRRTLLSSTIMSAMMLVSASSALAQQQPATETKDVAANAAEEAPETITVTGSRLTSKNVVSSSPVQTITEQAFDVVGAVDTIDLLNTLPAFTRAQDTSFANGANGTSTLDLRGLGSVRTLVLMNGKRLPPGSPTPGGYPSDINLIPAQLIQRVEVVTGGASAVYGSDAVAGVANFIMKRDFNGFELDGLFGFNQSNNNSADAQARLIAAGITPKTGSDTGNPTVDVSAVFGASLGSGRGNVTGYIRYMRNDGLNQSERDFSQCALSLGANPSPTCLGAPTGPFPTNFILTPVFAPGATTAIPLRNPDGSILLDANGNPRTSAALALQPDGSVRDGTNSFNFNPFNPLRRQVTRINAGFSGYYNLTDSIEAYAEFGFTKSTSPQVIAPSGGFGSEITRVNCDNPVLTVQMRQLFCGSASLTGPWPRDVDNDRYVQAQVQRRFVEGGPRTDERTLTNFRTVYGVKGDIVENLKFDVFGQWSETSLDRLQTNNVTRTPLLNALDIVTDPATRQPACRVAVAGTDRNCVPFITNYNPNGTNDPRLRAYLDTPTLTRGKTSQVMFGGTLQSDLGAFGIASPWAEDGISLLIGAEYRKETLVTRPDATASSGQLLAGAGALLPGDGQTQITEFFAETSIPLVQGRPFFDSLALTGAVRRSEYKSRNNLTGVRGGEFAPVSYALGISWAPVKDLRLRGQYQRAIRAPNILELFLPVNTGLANVADPCSGFAGTNQTPSRPLSACQRTGVTAAQYGAIPPSGAQVNIRTGGNPNLQPEVADTVTLGAVFQPSFVSNLSISLDFFNIRVKEAVGTVPAVFTIERCLDSGAPEFCSLINRGPDGSLTFRGEPSSFVDQRTQNIAGLSTSGIDAQVSYAHDIGGLGRLNWNYAATYLFAFKTTPIAGGFTANCVGKYDLQCQLPRFRYRHSLTTTWRTPWTVDIALNWRYQSAVDRILSINPTTGVPVTWTEAGRGNFTGARLNAESYIDLTAFWNITKKIQMRAGVRNLLDNDPPVVPQFNPAPSFTVEGNTVSGVYEAVGRFIFVGANVSF